MKFKVFNYNGLNQTSWQINTSDLFDPEFECTGKTNPKSLIKGKTKKEATKICVELFTDFLEMAGEKMILDKEAVLFPLADFGQMKILEMKDIEKNPNKIYGNASSYFRTFIPKIITSSKYYDPRKPYRMRFTGKLNRLLASELNRGVIYGI